MFDIFIPYLFLSCFVFEEFERAITSSLWVYTVFVFLLFLHPDVHVEPHKKQLHVTLAYHFQASHLPVLEKLAKNVDASTGCDWLAVLLSRDIRFANHEVHFL